MKSLRVTCLLFALLALLAAGCTTRPQAKAQADYDVAFTLTTLMEDEGMRFVGVGDEIDGLINPDLIVEPGDTVQVTLIKGDVTGNPHDFAVPDLDAKTSMVILKGQSADLVFETNDAGEFVYYCTIPGHREEGMEGKLIVTAP